jgi:hypothetical protein
MNLLRKFKKLLFDAFFNPHHPPVQPSELQIGSTPDAHGRFHLTLQYGSTSIYIADAHTFLQNIQNAVRKVGLQNARQSGILLPKDWRNTQ